MDINTSQAHLSYLKPVIVSIGAGEPKKRSITFKNGKNWGGINWIKPIIGVLMGGASSHVHNLTERVLGNNYLRFEVFLDEDIELDDSNDITLKNMKSRTLSYLNDDVGCDIESPSEYCFSSNMTELIHFLTVQTR